MWLKKKQGRCDCLEDQLDHDLHCLPVLSAFLDTFLCLCFFTYPNLNFWIITAKI